MASHVKPLTLSPGRACLSDSFRCRAGFGRTPCAMSVSCMCPCVQNWLYLAAYCCCNWWATEPNRTCRDERKTWNKITEMRGWRWGSDSGEEGKRDCVGREVRLGRLIHWWGNWLRSKGVPHLLSFTFLRTPQPEKRRKKGKNPDGSREWAGGDKMGETIAAGRLTCFHEVMD